MKAKTIKGKSTEEIQAALEEAMANGFEPTLATVFLSVKQDIKAICEILDKAGIEIFVSTTEGEIMGGKMGKGSVVILLMDINRDYFKVLFEEVGDGGYCEPPLDLVMRYGGITELPDNLYDIHEALNHTLQIQLHREKGDPIMRVDISNMEDRSFSFIGSMPEGAKIKFCLLPDLDVLDESVMAIENFKKEQSPEADAVFLFACAGRPVAFGPEISREIEGINKIWDAPMAGFFCQGEFGRATGGNLEVHNLTTCCVALKEIKT